jgi:hypothetical protein
MLQSMLALRRADDDRDVPTAGTLIEPGANNPCAVIEFEMRAADVSRQMIEARLQDQCAAFGVAGDGGILRDISRRLWLRCRATEVWDREEKSQLSLLSVHRLGHAR